MMLRKSSLESGGFKTLTFLVEIRKIEKIPKVRKRLRKALLLYELSEREPGWRFTARCHTGALVKPVPRAPRLSMTWACLHKFVANKTDWIWKCATWEMFFISRVFSLGEYQPLVVMQLRFPSGASFLEGGHFTRFFQKKWTILNFEKKQFENHLGRHIALRVWPAETRLMVYRRFETS